MMSHVDEKSEALSTVNTGGFLCNQKYVLNQDCRKV